ncbi:hypothetical protein FRC18_005099 [Serendipita sp. 400]|nr:hypothetical protein FRC18_005099 [Serendipita sp. 400]
MGQGVRASFPSFWGFDWNTSPNALFIGNNSPEAVSVPLSVSGRRSDATQPLGKPLGFPIRLFGANFSTFLVCKTDRQDFGSPSQTWKVATAHSRLRQRERHRQQITELSCDGKGAPMHELVEYRMTISSFSLWDWTRLHICSHLLTHYRTSVANTLPISISTHGNRSKLLRWQIKSSSWSIWRIFEIAQQNLIIQDNLCQGEIDR